MLRLAVSAGLLVSALPAAAEDWRLLGIKGASPSREAGVIDVDSINRTNPRQPSYKMALLLEAPTEDGVGHGVLTEVVDCDARMLKIVHISVYGPSGDLIASEAVTDDAFGAVETNTHAAIGAAGVCEGQWSADSHMGAGRSLEQIEIALFGG